MKELDAIKASADTVMTDDLVRAFKFGGCFPTACHACKKRILVGDVFKLLPHKQADLDDEGREVYRDEMCCSVCGEPELLVRDKRDAKNEAQARRRQRARNLASGGSGYSRPSKEPK